MSKARRSHPILFFVVLALSSCQIVPNYTDDQVIALSDSYISKRNPNFLIENPIRSVDQNDKYWLVYYLPVVPQGRPGTERNIKPEVGGGGFLVSVSKDTKEPEFMGFQQ